METHLSNNRSVVIRLESQYRSRTINMRGELELSPLLRQRGRPFTPAVSVSPAADTNANSERQEWENVRKIKYGYQWETWGDMRQGEDRVRALPEEWRPGWYPEDGFWRIYTLARHFNVSNIQTICLKKNKLLPRSKGTEAPWSRPSMFLFTAVFPHRLKADFITITFLIKAWICFLYDRPTSLSTEWRWHNILDPWQQKCQSH